MIRSIASVRRPTRQIMEVNRTYMDRFKELRNAVVASEGGVGYLVSEIMKTSSKYKD